MPLAPAHLLDACVSVRAEQLEDRIEKLSRASLKELTGDKVVKLLEKYGVTVPKEVPQIPLPNPSDGKPEYVIPRSSGSLPACSRVIIRAETPVHGRFLQTPI